MNAIHQDNPVMRFPRFSLQFLKITRFRNRLLTEINKVLKMSFPSRVGYVLVKGSALIIVRAS